MKTIIARAAVILSMFAPLSASALISRTATTSTTFTVQKTATVPTTTTEPTTTVIQPSVDVQETAGITASSPLFFFDKLVDDVAIALTFDSVAKTERILAVSEERAAETLVSAAAGDFEAAAESTQEVTRLMTSLDTTVQKISDPILLETTVVDIETTLGTNKTLLEQAFQSAPPDAQTFSVAVDDLNTRIGTTVETVIVKTESTPITESAPTIGCNQLKYESCLTTFGCTSGTSASCFLSCPPVTVPCDQPRTGKTCTRPDEACRAACLQKLTTCNADCLSVAGCKAEEVRPKEQPIPVEQIQRAFKLNVTSP